MSNTSRQMRAVVTSHIIPPKLLPPPASKPSPTPRCPQPTQAISISTANRPIPTVSVPPANEHVGDAATAFWDYQFLFVSQRSETEDSVMLRAVDGAIPADFPRGTYFLAGPGMFKDDHGSTVHPLDGHGYLRAFTFSGGEERGQVRFMARYVRTEAQEEEYDPVSGSWRFTHRGPFSVLKAGRKVGNTKVMKNVANTSVVSWGGRLLCLWEGGDPYEIEPSSLDTVGKFDVADSPESRDGAGATAGTGHGGNIWDAAAGVVKPILYGMCLLS